VRPERRTVRDQPSSTRTIDVSPTAVAWRPYRVRLAAAVGLGQTVRSGRCLRYQGKKSTLLAHTGTVAPTNQGKEGDRQEMVYA